MESIHGVEPDARERNKQVVWRNMKAWLRQLMDATSVMKSTRTTFDLLTSLTIDLGFEYFSYLHIGAAGLSRLTAISNFPPEWQNRYLARRYDALDPIITRSRESMSAFKWSGDDILKGSKPPVRRFCTEALSFGRRAGISIPIETTLRGVAIFTLATQNTERPQALTLEPVLSANAIALLHARIETAGATPISTPTPELTGRQAMLLKWSAEGRTMRDIAIIENMTYHNVSFHLNNAKKTLQADTLPQATAVATKLKLI